MGWSRFSPKKSSLARRLASTHWTIYEIGVTTFEDGLKFGHSKFAPGAECVYISDAWKFASVHNKCQSGHHIGFQNTWLMHHQKKRRVLFGTATMMIPCITLTCKKRSTCIKFKKSRNEIDKILLKKKLQAQDQLTWAFLQVTLKDSPGM